MPKTRAYTREELQGLRRADLQRLCKVSASLYGKLTGQTYDIKGANSKSDVLIDLLAQFFQSSAYNGGPSSQRQPPRSVARPAASHAFPSHSAKSKMRPAPTPASSSGVRSSRTVPVQRTTVPRGTGAAIQTSGPKTNKQSTTSRTARKPTPAPAGEQSPSELERLRTEVEQLKHTVARLEEQQSTMLAALLNSEDLQHRLRSLVAAEMASERGASANVTDCAILRPESRVSSELESRPSIQAKRKNDTSERASHLAIKRPRRDSSGRTNPSHTQCSLTPSKAGETSLSPCGVLQTPQPYEQPLVSDSSTSTPVVSSTSRSRSASCFHVQAELSGGCHTPSQTNMPLNSVNLSNLKPSTPSPGLLIATKNVTDSYTAAAAAPRGSPEDSGPLAFDNMSPAREYMDVALNGLTGHSKFSSTVPMPSVRTMLGTERYRDTRFGDEPIAPWGTPTIVDFGPPTPVRTSDMY
ncbi:hypothetical protein A1Q2_05507 [Trichosporon asahii var. asahii CBS 8904]|uniref:Uncharacterized protein n=1 Tax=Trichosporon asahii var. asahii (strain CBS 8904) TaxID=1220162 RepID=K1WF45_TRIAC|nr:hypothetical protein A1Q2_05507 [Trichosporon asahii var. asahii CBS 8904]